MCASESPTSKGIKILQYFHCSGEMNYFLDIWILCTVSPNLLDTPKVSKVDLPSVTASGNTAWLFQSLLWCPES